MTGKSSTTIHPPAALLCLALICLAAPGCAGGGAHPRGGTDQLPIGASTASVTEQAALVSQHAADRRMTALLTQQAPPVNAFLPGLPPAGGMARRASTLETVWLDGKDAALFGGGATKGVTQMLLAASGGGASWAIYAVALPGALDQVRTLTVETSGWHFVGAQPGYWTGIANYATGAWDVLGRSTQATYVHSIPSKLDYRNAAGLAYVFVLICGDGQQVNVERLGCEVNRQDWQEVTVDAGPNAGYSPALDFALNGNPALAYVDSASGESFFAIGDRASGLMDPANWILTTVDTPPDGKAGFVDLKIDTADGMPRIGVSYTEIAAGADNSKPGLSLLHDPGTGPVWLNYAINSFVDGAGYASVDCQETTAKYGVATVAANSNSPAKPQDDLHFLLWDLSDLANVTAAHYSSFGTGFINPHVRFRSTGEVSLNFAGGVLYYGLDVENWYSLYADAAAGGFGSLAYNPQAAGPTRLGIAFEKPGAGLDQLTYIGFPDSLFPQMPQTIASLTTSAAGAWIGRASQLAYAPSGVPAVAYALCDGAQVSIHYAHWDGAAWVDEPVSPDPGTPPGTGQSIQVDLAFDADGIAAIAYNHLAGAASSLRFAIRGS